MEKLFIYGTLAKGRANEHKLSDIEGRWQEAYVEGSLHKEGWGSEMGYPGISLENKKEKVQGFIFASEYLHKKWQELDTFEGHEYKRVLTQAYTKENECIEVFIYALNNK